MLMNNTSATGVNYAPSAKGTARLMISRLLELDSDRTEFVRFRSNVLRDIWLEVYRSEVPCLLGDNGAENQTLVRILSRFQQTDLRLASR